MAELLRKHPVMATIIGGVAAGVGLTLAVPVLVSGTNPYHAGEHLAQALPFAVIVVAAALFWPPPHQTPTGRYARLALVWGSVLVVAGLVAEAVGAFGYDGDEHAVEALTSLHNGVWPITYSGALLVWCSAMLAVIEAGAFRRRGPSATSEAA